MLLDEPFSNLDVRLRYQLRDLVLHVLKRSRAATVIVTHDPEEAMFMADLIAVMNNGRIVQIGTPEELYFRPKDAYVAGLFSELNRIRGRVVEGHVHTAVGRVCTPQIADGTDVEVFIRPDAIKIGKLSDHGPSARVQAARMLGRSSLVHLSVPDGEAQSFHVHARVHGYSKPSENDLVGLTLDQDQVFVFPDHAAE
jgi:iron(III) transport system ATP-binding protein